MVGVGGSVVSNYSTISAFKLGSSLNLVMFSWILIKELSGTGRRALSRFDSSSLMVEMRTLVYLFGSCLSFGIALIDLRGDALISRLGGSRLVL